MIQLVCTAAGTLLAGAFCAALLVAPVGERRPRLVRGGAWALWIIAGLLAASAVGAGVIGLCVRTAARTDSIGAFVLMVVGALVAATSVCLLGLYGFWAAIRRRTRSERTQ